MKNTYTNKLTITALLASLAFLSLSASAGQDEIQRQMIQRSFKLQQQTKAVEAAKQEAAVMKQSECMRQMELSNNATGT